MFQRMLNIRPISDLRNHTNQISRFCHKKGKPVFITKNGKGDLVVMSLSSYEKQQALLELYGKLEEAEQDEKIHPKGISHREIMRSLRKKL